MPWELEILKKYLSENNKSSITSRINEIMKSCQFSKFEFIETDLDLTIINSEGLELYKSITYEIAILSLNLFLDFHFYKRFLFEGRFDKPLYRDKLFKLGYELCDGMWKYSSNSKPSKSIVIENIFVYQFHFQLMEQKKEEILQSIQFSNNFDEIAAVETLQTPVVLKSHDNETGINVSLNGNSNEYTGDKSDDDVCSDSDCDMTSVKDRKLINNDNCGALRANIINEKYSNGTNISTTSGTTTASWVCKECTFVNDAAVNNCGACFIANVLTEVNVQSENKIPEKSATETFSSIEKENSSVEFNAPFADAGEVKKDIDETFWTCSSCTFKNKSDRLNCETCLNPNQQPVNDVTNVAATPVVSRSVSKISAENETDKENKSSYSTWVCTRCSSQNNNSNTECQACHNTLIEEPNFVNPIPETKTENLNPGSDQEINEYATLKVEQIAECLNCKANEKACANGLCEECSTAKYVCHNEACKFINKQKYSFCKKCKVEKFSDLKDGNLVKLKNIFIVKKRWQCQFCVRFNSEKHENCKKCGNKRK